MSSIVDELIASEDELQEMVNGEIEKQLKERNDVIDTMKNQMAKVLQEFEDMTFNISAKRSWMRSVNKANEQQNLTSVTPVSSTSPASSPSKLPKLGGKGTKKKPLPNFPKKNASGETIGEHGELRSPEGKIIVDRRLPRVALIEKSKDAAIQSVLASQQKHQIYERALVKYPQCRSSVFVPSSYDDLELHKGIGVGDNLPSTSYEMEFVYGVHINDNANMASTFNNGTNCNVNGNVIYLSTGEIVWYSATVVVLYSPNSNTQRQFREHTGEVTSLSLHPNNHIIASGQSSKDPILCVWDSAQENLNQNVTILKGHSVAVRCITFSHDGRLIASLGGDLYNTICIHDWSKQQLLVSARGHSFRVSSIAFNPYQAYGRADAKSKPGDALQDDDVCYTLVSCGVRHIRFWTLTKTEVTEENNDIAFFGSSFGSSSRLKNSNTPPEKVWKLEGNVPSFQGRMDVQDFTCVSFVDDSSPIYRFDEETNELVATNTNDHSFGRIIAGTAKGDLCVFWQARKSPEIDQILAKDPTVEPAKWWEIPDDYTDEDINQLVLEKISFESTARLVEMVPHDQETGNKFKVSKQVQLEMEGIIKRINMKPDSKVLQERLAEIRYNGPFGHNGAAFQIAYNKKNGLVVSCGADGRLILWKLQMPSPVRVPGVSTQGIFTPLTGSFSEGTHTLLPVDEETKVFHLPTTLPNDDTRPALHAKPTSLFWRDDGKSIVVGSSNHCIWELSIATGKWSLLFEARAGTIISCTSHPSKDEIVTISSDGYLALWDLQEHVCLQRLHFGTNAKANCVQFHPYGDEIAIGMTNGELLIVSYAEFRVMFKKTIRSSSNGSHTDFCITQLKYCTKAMYLAVGSKDTLIHIYDVTNNYKKAHVCEGHASAVVHVTWSANGDILMSNAADGELLFFIISQNKPPKQILDHFHVRDAQWSKWSVLYGWATPGVWGDDTSNLFDIPHVCTTNDSEYSSDEHEDLISVACRNTLRVFRFPCFRGAKYRAYHGHSGNILATCFSYKDNYLVSAGGEDGTIIQWKRKSMGSKKRYLSQHRKTYGDEDIDVVPVAPIPPPSHKNVDGYPSPRQQTRSYKEKSNISSMDESDRNAFILSQCQVLHEFIAENPDELNLCPGEIIRVLSKTNDEWWTGESCDGSKGIFPCSYVEEIQLDENIAEQSSVEPEVELSPPEAAPTRSLVPEPVSEITEIPETVVIPDVELLRPVQSEPKLENHVEINSADSIPDVEPIEHVQSEPRFENHVEISPTDNIPTDIDGSLDFPTEVWSGSAKSDQRYADVDE